MSTTEGRETLEESGKCVERHGVIVAAESAIGIGVLFHKYFSEVRSCAGKLVDRFNLEETVRSVPDNLCKYNSFKF